MTDQSDSATGGLPDAVTIAFMDMERMHPSDWRSAIDRDRPWTGQPQTDDGDRGRTEVRGVTFRDLKDAFIVGLFEASQVPEEQRGSVYELDLNAIDIIAAFQNMSCEIERRMGIYPNVPCLHYEGMDPGPPGGVVTDSDTIAPTIVKMTIEVEYDAGWLYAPGDDLAGKLPGSPADSRPFDEEDIETEAASALAHLDQDVRFRIAALNIGGEDKGSGVWRDAEW